MSHPEFAVTLRDAASQLELPGMKIFELVTTKGETDFCITTDFAVEAEIIEGIVCNIG